MSEPTRAEQIVYLTEWAARNHGTLQLSGNVGFGRDCVGILGSSDHYIDTAEAKNTYAYSPDHPYEWWEPEDSYHKHDWRRAYLAPVLRDAQEVKEPR